MDRQQCVLLLLLAALLAPSVAARRLRGDASSVAVSTGGTASSASTSLGDASVLTTTVAAQGGQAVASQTAASGYHEVAQVAVGNTTVMVQHHEPAKSVTWEDAPACPFSATATNSVKDDSSRLWGWHNGHSCAFKQPAYHVGETWDSAPACPASVPLTTAVKDNSGRLWGWHNNASCAFKATTRKLLQAASGKEGLSASSTSTISSDAPADSQDGLTTVDVTLGNGVGCTLVSVPDPVTKTVHDELRCTKPEDIASADGKGKKVAADLTAPVAITSAVDTADTANTAATTTAATSTSVAPLADAANAVIMADTDSSDDSADAVDAEDEADVVDADLDDTVDVADTVDAVDAVNVANTVNADNAAEAVDTASMTSPAPIEAALNSSPAAAASTAPNTPAATTSPQPVVSDAQPSTDSSADSGVVVPTAPLPITSVATSDSSPLLTAVNRFGTTWADAPVCTSKPSRKTAVQDTLGRLWWWEQNMSCAYRKADGSSLQYDGYSPVQWDASPPCKGTATLINCMADAHGRLWGWETDTHPEGVNCKFVNPDGKAIMHEVLLASVIKLAAAESEELRP